MWSAGSTVEANRPNKVLQDCLLEVLPELREASTRMRYYRELNDRNRSELLKYWSAALPKFFLAAYKQASIKFGVLSQVFIIEGYHLTSLAEILEILSQSGDFLLLESVETDGDYRKVKLNQVKPSRSLLGCLKHMIKGDTRGSLESEHESPLCKDHYIVYPALLEEFLQLFLQKDAALLKQRAYEDDFFKSKMDLVEFFESHQHSVSDSYLILHRLVQKGIINPSVRKNASKHQVKGYVLGSTEDPLYKAQNTLWLLRQNLGYLTTKILDIEDRCKVLHAKIIDNLKLNNKDIARTLGKEKIQAEKQVVSFMQKRNLIENAISDLEDHIENGSADESVWKMIRELNEQKLVMMEDLKETLLQSHEINEKNKEIDMALAGDEEEQQELQDELDKIAAEIGLTGLPGKESADARSIKSEKSRNTIEPEEAPKKSITINKIVTASTTIGQPEEFPLLRDPFISTVKKPNQLDIERPALQTTQPSTNFQSFFDRPAPAKPADNFMDKFRAASANSEQSMIRDAEDPLGAFRKTQQPPAQTQPHQTLFSRKPAGQPDQSTNQQQQQPDAFLTLR